MTRYACPLLPFAAILFLVFAPQWIWLYVPWHKVDTSYLMFVVALVLLAPIFVAAVTR